MTTHDWYVDNRLAFATRMLKGKEESLFANHVSRCIDCRAAVAQLERDLTWLPMGVAPVPLRPGLTHDLMHGVLHPMRTRRWQWIPTLAAAAALVAALAVWSETRREIGGLRSALEARQGRLRATEDSLSAILGAERVLQETVRGPGYTGGFLLFYDQDTQRWNVVVHDLPPAPAGEAYRLWFVTDRGLLPGPELRANGRRPTFLTLSAAGPSGDFVGAVLTVGPAGEPTGRPRIELARLTF